MEVIGDGGIDLRATRGGACRAALSAIVPGASACMRPPPEKRIGFTKPLGGANVAALGSNSDVARPQWGLRVRLVPGAQVE